MNLKHVNALILASASFATACGSDIAVGELGEEGGSPSEGGAATTTGGATGTGGASTTGGANTAGGATEPDSDTCFSDFSHIVQQPIPDCPDLPPENDSPCDIDENAMCTWQGYDGLGTGDGQYMTSGCYMSTGGSKVWFGRPGVSAAQGGVHRERCPHSPVEADTSCAGHEGEVCAYPEEACLCDDRNAKWTCQQQPTSLPPPIEVERVCAPVDETKLVKDLTDEEVDAWCRWSLDVLGRPGPLFGPSQPPYDARNYGDRFGGLHGEVCHPVLPPDLCARNMRLFPACDATVRTLDDCIETIQAVAHTGTLGITSRGWVGHGCAPLLDNPKCTNLAVMKWPADNGQCPLPLE